MGEEEKHRVDLNVVQVVASALAAVSSAVLLSTVGVAGTVIGAAVGSVVATVATSVYTYSLRVSRERVAAAAQVAAMARVRRPGAVAGPTSQEPPQEAIEEAEQAARPRWREALAGLPRKRVAMAAGAVFVIAMCVILGFELISGRSVSTYTGGTKDQGARTSLGGGPAARSTPTPSPSPTAQTSSPSPTETPSEESSSASPTESPTTSPSPTQTPSEEESTPSPSVSPSEPTATASPTSSPSD